MREHRVHQFFFRGFQSHGEDEALDQFCHFSTHHMGTNEASGFCVENGFDQALVFTQCNGLAVRQKGEAANFEVISSGLGLGFREATEATCGWQ